MEYIETSPLLRRSIYLFGYALVILGLFLSKNNSYVLFHSLVEIFTIIIAGVVFIITWHSRHLMKNNYLLFLGIAFAFISFFDLLHTLSYKGVGLIGSDANLPTQLWIAARLMQAISLFIAPLMIGKKMKLSYVIFGFAATTFVLFFSIFVWKIFPTCYVEGVGLTVFKKISEYVISLILLGSIFLLHQKRDRFDRKVMNLLMWAIIISIASEISFTEYVSVYGNANFLGHMLKLFEFYLIYKAIIVTGLTKPVNLLFLDLKKREKELEMERDRTKKYLELAKVAFVVIDADQKVSMVNKKACELLGWEENEIIGNKWFDTYIPENIREQMKDVHSMLMEGKMAEFGYFENAVIRKGIEERTVAWHNTLLKDEKDNIIGILCAGEDITDYKNRQSHMCAIAKKIAEEV